MLLLPMDHPTLMMFLFVLMRNSVLLNKQGVAIQHVCIWHQAANSASASYWWQQLVGVMLIQQKERLAVAEVFVVVASAICCKRNLDMCIVCDHIIIAVLLSEPKQPPALQRQAVLPNLPASN